MSNILLVTSSPRGAASHSSRLARSLAERLASGEAGSKLVIRDLSREPLPHIGEDFVTAQATPAAQRSAAQSAAVALSDRLIAEVQAADVLVIASAMINFGIASTLKTYIDHLLRAGSTFRYTENGPEGLVKGKKAYIVQASGGVYSQGPLQAYNFQDTYLKRVLGFIGISDVEVISIEGIALGAEAAEKALQAAAGRVSSIAPHVAAA